MEKKLIPILIILLAALLFTSSCTGVYTTSLPVAVSPSPVPDVSPAPTATTSPRVTPSPSLSPTPTPPPYEGTDTATTTAGRIPPRVLTAPVLSIMFSSSLGIGSTVWRRTRP